MWFQVNNRNNNNVPADHRVKLKQSEREINTLILLEN